MAKEMSPKQTKANVLIYTETNRSFIEEKIYDEFKYECLKDDQLKDLDINKMVKVMKVIYDFGQTNPHMFNFFQRAPDNIYKFITEQYKNTNQMNDLIIDMGKLLDVIFYCIDNGFAQPIVEKNKQEKIEKDKPKEKEKEKDKEDKKEHKKQVKIEQSAEQKQKVKKFYVPKPKTPQKKNFIEKFDMPETKMPARYLMNLPKQIKKEESENEDFSVAPIDLSLLEKNKQIIEKRLEDLFKHYCSQQQNLGKNATFDRIKEECSQMTVGKFLLFCKVSKIFNDKQITKELLTSKYKRVGQGKKQIQFDKFKQLLQLIDQQYISIKKKSEGESYVVPTYEARLLLHSLDYKKLKRDVDLPFCTRQKEGRQLKQYSTIEARMLPKKEDLTSHSGKFGKDLKMQLQKRIISQSMSGKASKKSVSIQQKEAKSDRKIFRLDNIRNQNFAGMQWVIEQDQSDKTFMKEYRTRDVVGEIKKRVNDLEKMEKQK